MAAWKTLGDWLMDSGWSEVITETDITISGRAYVLTTASHFSCTCHAHQVTGASLYTLWQKAYTYYMSNLIQGHVYMIGKNV